MAVSFELYGLFITVALKSPTTIGFVPDDGQGPPAVEIADDACSFQKPLGAFGLEGKKAVITGADKGAGRSTAIRFAEEGAEVFIVYLPREEEAAHVTQKRVESYGKVCHLFATDSDHKDKCKKAIDEAVFVMGGFNILCNSAPYQKMIDTHHEVDRAQVKHTCKTDIHPLLLPCKVRNPASEVWRLHHQQFERPHISLPGGHAVARLSEDLARQYFRQGLRINCIYEDNFSMTFPDWVMKQFTSDELLHAKGVDEQPDLIAGVVTFLASKELSAPASTDINSSARAP